MKVTYNWLKDFVDISIAPRVLADKLTMAGLEVVSLKEVGDDTVLEIEITSNRSDWLSVVGIAREVAAVTNQKLRIPKIVHSPRSTVRSPKDKNGCLSSERDYRRLSLKIQSFQDCPLYTAKIICGVTVGATPEWMRKRLELVGCRSINNIVDITNYILFEYGQPLHAFDADKLNSGAIAVRRAAAGEKIITIDGQEKNLDPDILVIAGDHAPVAVAGVMGGKDTEVTGETRNILLEAAVFNPVAVRRGRQKLGIQSDSSYRFERGVDTQGVEAASLRAVSLIQECAGGIYSAKKSTRYVPAKKTAVTVDLERMRMILCEDISNQKAKVILENLGFAVAKKGAAGFMVKVPSFRSDVAIDMDLMEEIGRVYGYERIAHTVPMFTPRIVQAEKTVHITRIKELLLGLGLQEVITYSLIDKETAGMFKHAGQAPEVVNPLSREQEIMRQSLIPSLVQRVAYNIHRKQERVTIFEIAAGYTVRADGGFHEELLLSCAICGIKSWITHEGLIKEKTGMLHAKGIAETILKRSGVRDYSFVMDTAGEASVYIPTPQPLEASLAFGGGTTAMPVGCSIGREKIGILAMLGKDILEQFDVKNKEVYVVELSLDKILAHAEPQKKFEPLAVYPAICRDLSLVVKEEVAFAEVARLIHEKGQPWLREVQPVDYYKGKQIPAGYKGLTISCVYRSDERTLTEDEINPLHSAVVDTVKEKFSAQIR